MIRFTDTVEIGRPPAAVFRFITAPERLREWQGTAEVEQLTPGPVGTGTRFREVHRVMGRTNEQITEVVEHDPPRTFSVRIVEGPVPVDGRWELEATPAGTRVTLTATGEAPRPLRFAAPLLVPLMRRRFAANHRRLKAALERSPADDPADTPPG